MAYKKGMSKADMEEEKEEKKEDPKEEKGETKEEEDAEESKEGDESPVVSALKNRPGKKGVNLLGIVAKLRAKRAKK